MMKIFKTFVLGFCCQLMVQQATAQVDPHFTQYYIYPSWTNPALTGAFDGNYRVSGIYRNQWGSVSAPYSTAGVGAEFTTNKNMNYGISVLNQTAGNGGYRYTTAYGNLAYTGLRFGPTENHRIVFGMQLGLIQRRFDASKLSFGDQWNPVTGYNSSNPTADVLRNPSASSFDVGAGILYFDATPNRNANFYAGYSAGHLTKPTDVFSGSGKDNLPMRQTFHAGVKIRVNDNFSLTPNALYLKQGSATEKMVGVYGQLKAAAATDLLLGANYRFEDAISPFAGISHNNFVVGLSYDINTSDLGKLVKGSSSFEISLSFTGKKKVQTPEVEFVCPRL